MLPQRCPIALRFVLVITMSLLTAAQALADEGTDPPRHDYAPLLDDLSTIAIGKVGPLTKTDAGSRATITVSRTLYKPDGGRLVSTPLVIPAGVTAFSEGSEGIFLLDTQQRADQPLRFVPLTEEEAIVAALLPWHEQRVVAASAALNKALQDDADLALPATRDLLMQLVKAVNAEAGTPRPEAMSQQAERIEAVYKLIGAPLPYPVVVRTEQDRAAQLRMALQHPFFREKLPEPGSKRYESVVQAVPGLVTHHAMSMLQSMVTISDERLAESLQKLQQHEPSKTATLKTRIDLLREFNRLMEAGQLPDW